MMLLALLDFGSSLCRLHYFFSFFFFEFWFSLSLAWLISIFFRLSSKSFARVALPFAGVCTFAGTYLDYKNREPLLVVAVVCHADFFRFSRGLGYLSCPFRHELNHCSNLFGLLSSCTIFVLLLRFYYQLYSCKYN